MATTLYSKKSTGNQSERGFTLAELLIVVAIIAVLTAIAIPVFTAQLERSREATDLSNIRAAYAEVLEDYLDAGAKVEKSAQVQDVKQQTRGWVLEDGAPRLYTRVDGEEKFQDLRTVQIAKGDTVTVKIDADGEVTVTGSFGGVSITGTGGPGSALVAAFPALTDAMKSNAKNEIYSNDILTWVDVEDVRIYPYGTNSKYEGKPVIYSYTYQHYCRDPVSIGTVYKSSSGSYFQTDGSHWYKWNEESQEWGFYN